MLERIVKLSKLASKDASRFTLNGVWLSWQCGYPVLEVTDGHKASIEKLGKDALPEFSGEFLVTLEHVAMLKVLMKQWSDAPVSYDKALDQLHFGFNSEVRVARTTHKKPSFKSFYVEYDNSATKPVPDEYLQPGAHIPVFTTIGINAKYLLEIAEALKESKEPHVKLVIKDKISPITVFCGDRTAVVMPVRV